MKTILVILLILSAPQALLRATDPVPVHVGSARIGTKTLTLSNTLTLAGTDGSTLNIGTGGTLAPVATAGSLFGNTLFVDAVNGNDSTAARGRADKAFLTLGAAKTAASSGDTIIVNPGTYNETNLGKNGVSWYFEPGAAVTYTGSSSVGIWDDYAGPLVATVKGGGVFTWTSTASNPSNSGVVNIQNSGSDFNIECRSLVLGAIAVAGSPGASTINQTNGIVRVKAFTIIDLSGSNSAAIWWTQGECHIDAFNINAANYVLYAADGGAQATNNQALWIHANYITGKTLFWGGNPTSQLWLDALEIDLSSNAGSFSGGFVGLGGGKAYVTVQKILGNSTAPGYAPLNGSVLSASNAWLNINKVTQQGAACAVALGGGVTGRIDHIESVGTNVLDLLLVGGGVNDLAVQKMVVTNPSGVGLEHLGGTLRLRGAAIDASAATSGNAVKVSGSGLILTGAQLTAATGRDSIYAAAAQTVSVVGAVNTNGTINSNVTLDFSQNKTGDASAAALTAETTRATGAESTLTTNVATNTAGIATNATAISAEATTARNASGLTSGLAAPARVTADAALSLSSASATHLANGGVARQSRKVVLGAGSGPYLAQLILDAPTASTGGGADAYGAWQDIRMEFPAGGNAGVQILGADGTTVLFSESVTPGAGVPAYAIDAQFVYPTTAWRLHDSFLTP